MNPAGAQRHPLRIAEAMGGLSGEARKPLRRELRNVGAGRARQMALSGRASEWWKQGASAASGASPAWADRRCG
eukprot:CAMPEP_0172207134 /NCGR_PEP_ID=MMETSP1050-20130122/33650_1 /TAXON_ID=233186 /ORGANISM="Cryptomonas curvata, Strain CCAP979/52" /LENGTH=73 /DNA_ID=CAMNT_0012886385 /DNA_START=271 /DNA_END=492 /DNA_ORIENTATION=-